MFNWVKKLFGIEEKQKQVVDSGRVSIQAGGDITISTPGSIHLTAKTIEAPAVSREDERVLAAIRARHQVQSTQTARRNPAPHASAARTPSRTSRSSVSNDDYRRRNDYDNSPSLVDYAVMHAVTSNSYDNSSSYSSSSSSDSCSSSSSSSYDSGSSSSDSGSCGGGD